MLVVTKADLADPAGVERSVGVLNPVASVVRAVQGDVDPALLLGRRREGLVVIHHKRRPAPTHTTTVTRRTSAR